MAPKTINNLRRLTLAEINYCYLNRLESICKSCNRPSHDFNYCINCVYEQKHLVKATTYKREHKRTILSFMKTMGKQ